MAPETIDPQQKADARSDLYALGAVGYYLLTAEHVFDGSNIPEIWMKHLSEPPVPPSERLGKPLPEDLERLILAALSKNPVDRPQSAAAFEEALASCKDAGDWNAREANTWWGEHPEIRAKSADELTETQLTPAPTPPSEAAVGDTSEEGSEPEGPEKEGDRESH